MSGIFYDWNGTGPLSKVATAETHLPNRMQYIQYVYTSMGLMNQRAENT